MAVVHEGAIDGLDAGGAVGIEGRGGGDGGRLLLLVGSVDGFDPRVRGVLWTLGDGVVEFFQRAVNVAWYGDVDVAVGVVPVQGESAVERSGPVGGDLVVLFEGGLKVQGVGFREVFDAEVVNA